MFKRIIFLFGFLGLSLAPTHLAAQAAQPTLYVADSEVVVTTVPGESTFEVHVPIHALGPNGLPIEPFAPTQVEVLEQGAPLEILGAQPAAPVACYVLVLDSSGGMFNVMNQVKQGLEALITALPPEACLSLIMFRGADDADIIDLTQDHGGVLNALSTAQAVEWSGTCLWDALYQGLNVSATADRPTALLVVSDGIDEIANPSNRNEFLPCSQHTPADVVAHANAAHIPIYSLAIPTEPLTTERRQKAQEMSQVSLETGALSLQMKSPLEIEAAFERLMTLMEARYELSFLSNAPPKTETTVIMKLNHGDQTAVDELVFQTPPLQPRLGITVPESPTPETEDMTVTVSVSPPGSVSLVRLYVDNELAQSMVPTEPVGAFEAELDWTTVEPGNHVFEAVGYDTLGDEVARSERITSHKDAPLPVPVEPAEQEPEPSSNSLPLAPFVVVLAALFGFGSMRLFRRRRSRSLPVPISLPDVVPSELDDPLFDQINTTAVTTDVRQEIRPVAQLVVEESGSSAGVIFPLYDSSIDVMLGRDKGNEMVIGDPSVSRVHARIHYREGTHWIYDRESLHGIDVDGQRVTADGYPLEHGVAVRLGPGTTIRYEALNGKAGHD